MKGKSSVVQVDVNRTEKSSLEYISICLVSMIKFVGSVNKINKKAGHSVEYIWEWFMLQQNTFTEATSL